MERNGGYLRVLQEIEKGSLKSVRELKGILEKNDGVGWEIILSYAGCIELTCRRDRDVIFPGIWILSQICINVYSEGVVEMVRRLYDDGNVAVKKEVLRAVSAIFQVNSQYGPIINQTFLITDLLKDLDFDELFEFLNVPCRFPQPIPTQEKILQILNEMIETQFAESLQLINELIQVNPKSAEYFNRELLRKLLKNLLIDADIRLVILKILGHYIVNIEDSYKKLLELKVFDYLLHVMHNFDYCTRDCLWVVSNLVCESDIVVEVLIVNHGFIEILELLNSKSSSTCAEIVFIIYNASRVCTSLQAKFFIDIGTLNALVTLIGHQNSKTLLISLTNFLKKYSEISLEDLIDLINTIEDLHLSNSFAKSSLHYLNTLAKSKI